MWRSVIERPRSPTGAFNKGREDEGAVAELVTLAVGSKRTLDNAERFSRQGARHCDDRNFNRAHRLLVAAVAGKPVESVSPDDKRTFKIVKKFRALPPWLGATTVP